MNIYPPMQVYTGIVDKRVVAQEFDALSKALYDKMSPDYPGYMFVCSAAEEYSSCPLVIKAYIRKLLTVPDTGYVCATVGEYVHDCIKRLSWANMTTYEKNLYRAAWCAHIAKELAK